MENLKSVDSEKYQQAVEITSNPEFGLEASFLVLTIGEDRVIGHNPGGLAHTNPRFYPDIVFLMPSALVFPYFDVIIAHELGHLKYKHGFSGEFNEDEETQADNFAAQIAGKNRVKKARSSSASAD